MAHCAVTRIFKFFWDTARSFSKRNWRRIGSWTIYSGSSCFLRNIQKTRSYEFLITKEKSQLDCNNEEDYKIISPTANYLRFLKDVISIERWTSNCHPISFYYPKLAFCQEIYHPKKCSLKFCETRMFSIKKRKAWMYSKKWSVFQKLLKGWFT